MTDASNITAPTQFIETKVEKYAYRRFGSGAGVPLLCLQHFTGTLDNWDPAVTDPLALGREVMFLKALVWAGRVERSRRPWPGWRRTRLHSWMRFALSEWISSVTLSAGWSRSR
jgi:hypothetical protein